MRGIPPLVAARPFTRNAALRRPVLSLLLMIACAPMLPGCLAFKDFEVLDDPAASSGGDGAGSSQVECAGSFECIGHVLYSCDNGLLAREPIQDCRASEQWCNAEIGACTECQVGSRPLCEGNVLRTCGPSGQYGAGIDCGAQGLYCTIAKTECVPCLSGVTYCVPKGPDDQYDGLFTCAHFEIQERAGECALGCLPTGDGGGACARCAVSGELYCDTKDLLRCPEDRTQRPPIEQQCPNGCDPDADIVECSPSAL